MAIKDKRILITGAAGSIGSELTRQLAVENKIFGLDLNETALFMLREELKQKGLWVHSRTGDIRDSEVIKDVFEDFKPQYVFHAAALKNVIPNEEYPIEAIKTNILGTYNLIYESKKWECLEKFVFISTDKVVNSECVMGITKRCAESLVRRAGKKFVVVRFGNVLGSRGSVLDIWKRQFENKEPLTITDVNMERYMISLKEACELVTTAAEAGNNGEIYILRMDKIKLIDLKTKLYGDYPFRLIGIRPGETLSEKLMTKEEEKNITKTKQFYIIKNL